MIARDRTADECEVVVKGTIGGEARGGYRLAGRHLPDRPRRQTLRSPTPTCARSPSPRARSSPTPACRRARAGASASTATRTGIFDRDELDAGSDPTNAASVPVPPTPDSRQLPQPARRRQPAGEPRPAQALLQVVALARHAERRRGAGGRWPRRSHRRGRRADRVRRGRQPRHPDPPRSELDAERIVHQPGLQVRRQAPGERARSRRSP